MTKTDEIPLSTTAERQAVVSSAGQAPGGDGVGHRGIEGRELRERLIDGLDHLVQALLAHALLALRRVVVLQRDPRPCRKAFDRTHEVEVLHLAHEGDGITTRLASEAVVDAQLGIDGEAP